MSAALDLQRVEDVHGEPVGELGGLAVEWLRQRCAQPARPVDEQVPEVRQPGDDLGHRRAGVRGAVEEEHPAAPVPDLLDADVAAESGRPYWSG